MKNGRCLTHRYGRQHGVALITGLIFMVVLTLLGITAARMAGLEERMSGNMRDRSLAVQAAERALRDAEQDIRNPNKRVDSAAGVVGAQTCTGGVCYNGPNGGVVADANNWNTRPVWDQFSMTAAPSVAYSDFTTAPFIPGLSAQPRYLIERIEKMCWTPTTCDGVKTPGYRITVRAQGANPNTVVWLQEVFKP